MLIPDIKTMAKNNNLTFIVCYGCTVDISTNITNNQFLNSSLKTFEKLPADKIPAGSLKRHYKLAFGLLNTCLG
jgi:hypothetical protein